MYTARNSLERQGFGLTVFLLNLRRRCYSKPRLKNFGSLVDSRLRQALALCFLATLIPSILVMLYIDKTTGISLFGGGLWTVVPLALSLKFALRTDPLFSPQRIVQILLRASALKWVSFMCLGVALLCTPGLKLDVLMVMMVTIKVLYLVLVMTLPKSSAA